MKHVDEEAMTTVTVEEAQGRLKVIIAGLNPGEALVIVSDGEPVATLARAAPMPRLSKAGCHRKAEFWMAPDFDAPLRVLPATEARPTSPSGGRTE